MVACWRNSKAEWPRRSGQKPKFSVSPTLTARRTCPRRRTPRGGFVPFLSSDMLRMPSTARVSHSDRLTDSAFTHGFKQPLRRGAYPLVAQVEIVPNVGKARQPFGF